MKQAIQQWLMMLNPREKVMVFGGLGIALLLVLWGAVWEPLKTQHTKLETQIQERENELRWMQTAQGKIIFAQKNPIKKRPVAAKNPTRVIETALQKHKLKSGLKKMRGGKEVKLSLKEVHADNVMSFLGELETVHFLRIIQMDIIPINKKGLVSVNLKIGK